MRREQTDVLVVGGGPAGLAAAQAAAQAGSRVRLLDDNPHLGGQIWRRDTSESATSKNDKAQTRREQLRDAGVVIRNRTTVIDASGPHDLWTHDDGDLVHVHAGHVILATGASELLLPFPGWTRPGVFGVGGLQALAKAGLDVEGQRVVVAGTGPLLLAVAANLRARGAEVVRVLEQTSSARMLRFGLGLWSRPSKLSQGLALRAAAGAPVQTGAWVVQALGEPQITSVVVRHHDGRDEQVDCDLLACGYGLVPQTRLARLLGCAVEQAITVDALQRTSIPTVLAAGEACGIGGQDKALVEGRIAGMVAAGQEKRAASLLRSRDRWRGFSRRLARDFALRDELRALPSAQTTVCRCEDVPLSAVQRFDSGRSAKLSTRCGMGSCQGRVCQPALEFLLGHGQDRPRPPLVPVPLGVLAELQSTTQGAPS